MEVEAACGDGVVSSSSEMQELWPLGEVDQKGTRFPCCIVWTPLPVVSWLAPYIGHVGIAREDGTVMDFAGSNFVSVDDLAYGSAARYLQLDRRKVYLFSPGFMLHLISEYFRNQATNMNLQFTL